jgi:hypothetical protein
MSEGARAAKLTKEAASEAANPARPAEPAVLAVVEMNLEEYPAFRLGRRSKRPELQYVRTRSEQDGRTFRQTWTVRGSEGLGLPGSFEQDLYVALLVLFTEQGLPGDGRIRFTRNRLAQVMGCSNSGRGYELIEQGLARLAGATVQTEYAFYRPAPLDKDGERNGPAERLSLTFHILEEVRVYERRAAALAEELARAAGGTAALEVRVEHARPLELSVARLGQPLVQSYERRYTKGLDATFYFSLTRPLGKRLYRYLDKVRNGRGSFEIGLRALADVLGLEYRYPSDIKDGLLEAHAELQSAGYLASAAYAPLAGGPGAGEKVVYALDLAFDRRPRRRAGAALPGPGRTSPPDSLSIGIGRGNATRQDGGGSPEKPPLQSELEAFGITPARAKALVEAHSEAHIRSRIEYVRGLMEHRPSQAGRSAARTTVKNPAGLLARAIEQSYVVPEPARPAAPAQRLEAATEKRPESAAVAPGLVPRPAGVPPTAVVAPATALPGEHLDEPAADLASNHPLWSGLAAALKDRLSPATYAAWIAPAQPLPPADDGDPAPESSGSKRSLTIVVPNAFALDRWHRPPIAPTLKDAATELGISVTLSLPPADH